MLIIKILVLFDFLKGFIMMAVCVVSTFDLFFFEYSLHMFEFLFFVIFSEFSEESLMVVLESKDHVGCQQHMFKMVSFFRVVAQYLD